MNRNLVTVRDRIVSCDRCARLREYCERIGIEKRRAFRDDTYWARPVPGFGDPGARLLIVGLAPAAHGANRTGRVFTGDGAGGSGDFLMAALHRRGFANQPISRHREDGLELHDAFIAAAVRCAPPGNKPETSEENNCRPFLTARLEMFPNLRAIVTLGDVSRRNVLKALGLKASAGVPGHGSEFQAGPYRIFNSYHCSRLNTNTGRLTTPMFEDLFARVKAYLDETA